MIDKNYFAYKCMFVSKKDYSDLEKIRLWKASPNDSSVMKLVSVKGYDKESNFIERSCGNRYSKIPMVNQANKGKTLDFLVKEGDFLLEGKQCDGKIVEIVQKKMFPACKESFDKLGNLARRYCSKLMSKTGLSLAELSKLAIVK